MKLINNAEILELKTSKALIKLAIPIFIGMTIHSAYHAVDLFFIGTVSSKYQASIGFIYPISFLFYGIMNGVGVGLTSIIGNKFGASKFKEISFYERSGLYFMLFLSAVYFISVIFFGKIILTKLGVPDELLQDTYKYLYIISSISVFDAFNIASRSIYTGKGNSKTPMLIIGTFVLLNACLDPLFIYFYGFLGAAIATSLCNVSTSLVFLYKIFKDKFINIKPINFINKNLIIILKIGVPASLSMLIIAFGNMVTNYVVNYYSVYAVASMQIITRIEDIFFLFVISTSYAGMTLVSMYFGAKKFKNVRLIIFKVLSLNLFTAFIIALIFYNFSEYFILIFSKNEKVLEVGKSYFKHISYMYPIIAFGLTTGRLLQGFGSSMPLFAITSIRVLLISAPLSYLFSYLYNKPIEYIWYSIIVAAIVSSFTALIWLKIKLKNFSIKFLK